MKYNYLKNERNPKTEIFLTYKYLNPSKLQLSQYHIIRVRLR